MNLRTFSEREKLYDKIEVEKVAYLAFFELAVNQRAEFSISEISANFDYLHFSKPNPSRLSQRLKDSRDFSSAGSGKFKLHATKLKLLEETLSYLRSPSEELTFRGEILPATLFSSTRGYLEQLAKQINTAYENNVFDGCAVLMRRTIEILLILSFRNIGEEARIHENGQFVDLSTIIGRAIPEPKLGLSKQTRDCLDKFRALGNFSAHKIEYNCKRDDIRIVALDFRAAFEELLYKAGLRK